MDFICKDRCRVRAQARKVCEQPKIRRYARPSQGFPLTFHSQLREVTVPWLAGYPTPVVIRSLPQLRCRLPRRASSGRPSPPPARAPSPRWRPSVARAAARELAPCASSQGLRRRSRRVRRSRRRGAARRAWRAAWRRGARGSPPRGPTLSPAPPPPGYRTCERVGAQIRSLGRTTGGLAGGIEGAGATA